MARAFHGETIATGATLLSSLAAALAKALYDDDLVLVGESWGSFDCDPGPQMANGEWLTRVSARGSVDWSMCFDYISADMLTIFTGPVQIDRHGNANISVVGDWNNPTVQLIGSRGLPDDLWRCSVIHYHIPRHTPRSVMAAVDFISSFGYGPRRESYPNAKGRPGLLVTDLGVFKWPDESEEMVVESLHPGVTADRARGATGFELDIPEGVAVTEPPTGDELRVLRELVDPFDYRNGSALSKLGDQVGRLVGRSLIPRFRDEGEVIQ
jgi:glutaconate CoA-transferase subunit B